MSRSTKKGAYIDPRLLEKVNKVIAEGARKVVRTWARDCVISPIMVSFTFEVHNGRDFIPVFVTESMVGHRLGEFSATRKFSGHSKKGKIAKATGSAGRVDTEAL